MTELTKEEVIFAAAVAARILKEEVENLGPDHLPHYFEEFAVKAERVAALLRLAAEMTKQQG